MYPSFSSSSPTSSKLKMYPSSNSCNYNPNISSSNNLFHIPSPNSMQYEHELFQYFHDHHLLQPQQQQQQQQQLLTTPDHYMVADSNKDTVISSTINQLEEGPEEVELKGSCKNKKGDNKRAVAHKKDRHSKINTAHGPRDRRMRLSLDVARKFFNLQDLLGFDKASKTVEWLLTKSKSAVNELVQSTATGGISTSSTTSECEVISGIDESTTANDIQKQPNRSKVGEKKKANKLARRAVFNPVAKESRKQARARARERTKIKKSILNIGDQSMAADELKRLGCWSPFETGEESGIQGYSTNHQVEDQHTTHHEEHLLGTKENVDDCNLVVTGNWNPFTIFNYHHNTEISHEQQFTNFQFSGKFWEA